MIWQRACGKDMGLVVGRYKPVSKGDFQQKIGGGGWQKACGKEMRDELVMWSLYCLWIPEQGQLNWSCLIDVVLQGSLFCFFCVITCRVGILEFLFFVLFAYLEYSIAYWVWRDDGTKFCLSERSVLHIFSFNGF